MRFARVHAAAHPPPTPPGGIYRRAGVAPSYSWLPLLDWADPAQSEYYSVSALAVAPVDGAHLIAMAGSYWAWSNCSILISHDAGSTWAVRNTTGWGLRCGGNENDRAVGDRMAQHPTLAGVVAVGGSDGRVYVTTDEFATLPTQVVLPPPAQPSACAPHVNDSCVVRSVAWLATAGGEMLLLAAVPGVGLFASAGPQYADAASWAFVAGSSAPRVVARLALVPEAPGRVWATAANGVWGGTVSPAPGGGWAVAWDIAGALAYVGQPFAGIAVRAGGIDITAMTLDYNTNTTLWRSVDGGATWTRLVWNVTSPVPWWGGFMLGLNAAASLAWEEGEKGETLWVTDFFGTYAAVAADSPSTPLHFIAAEAGHEETCINFVKAPPVGDVISGAADVGAWRHDAGVAVYPSENVHAADGWAHVRVLDGGAANRSRGAPTQQGGEGCSRKINLCVQYLRPTSPPHTPPHHPAPPPRPHTPPHHPAPQNCYFDADLTLALAPSGTTADALWVTAGDEYGSCHGTPSWCGLHSYVGVSRDGGATFSDTTWDSVHAVDQANPYRVAVHPYNGARALVAARDGLPLTFTRDYGQTWGNSTGGPVSVGQQGCVRVVLGWHEQAS